MTKYRDSVDIFDEARKGKPGCIFCSPVSGMQIEETENFRVLIDTFPVVPGHVMISSKGHYGSAGEVPSHLQDELCLLKDVVRKEVLLVSGNVFFYEHGRAGCCMAANPDGSKCEHFHLHCLPIGIDLQHFKDDRFQEIVVERYSEISPLFLKYGNYLFIESEDQGMRFLPVEDEVVESHLLRTLICEVLNVKERSNWEDYNDPALFDQSHELVRKMNFSRVECSI